MKYVFFEKVKIQNFLSVGEEPIEINFQSGVTLITGENRDKGGRNGVGKSTVVESLYWCLFGTTMRDIKRDKIIHNQSKSSCEVKLYFTVKNSTKTDNYILTRSIEPNEVTLFCNNVNITRPSMPKTDELVKEIIGATEKVFENAVIMSANNTTSFMAQKKVDKRKFVEGVLHLGVFGDMLLQIRAEHNDTRKQNDIIINQFEDQQKKLKIYTDQFNKIDFNKREKIKNLNSKIKDNLNKIQEISNSEDVEKQKQKLEEYVLKREEKISTLKNLFKECEVKMLDFLQKSQILGLQQEQIEEELTKLNNTNTFCFTCKRPFEGVDLNHLNSVKENLNVKLKDIKSSLKEIKKTVQDQTQSCKKISSHIDTLTEEILLKNNEKQKLALISQEINSLQNRNDELQKEILEIENSENEFQILLDETNISIKKTEEDIVNLQKKISILDTAKYVVSEDGVKTFIIKKMLSILNSRLNFYLQALEAPCKCEFNEMFEETIFNDQGKECSYFNFSGGERKRIDLAILFMFQDLLRMQTGTSFSLSIYDELLDSAMDEKGIQKVLDILKTRVDKYNENVYIISHNKQAINSGINQFIFLEKHNGKTRIIQ